MVNEQLLGWVQNGKAQGYTLEQLKSALLQQGYQLEEINQILVMVYPENQAASVGKTVVKTPIRILPYIIGGIGLIIILQIGMFFYFSKNAEDYIVPKQDKIIVESLDNSLDAIPVTSAEDNVE